MEDIVCDLLKVGGESTGCSRVAEIAKEIFNTILIEKEEVIGKPVKCLEGIEFYLMPLFLFVILKENYNILKLKIYFKRWNYKN